MLRMRPKPGRREEAVDTSIPPCSNSRNHLVITPEPGSTTASAMQTDAAVGIEAQTMSTGRSLRERESIVQGVEKCCSRKPAATTKLAGNHSVQRRVLPASLCSGLLPTRRCARPELDADALVHELQSVDLPIVGVGPDGPGLDHRVEEVLDARVGHGADAEPQGVARIDDAVFPQLGE